MSYKTNKGDAADATLSERIDSIVARCSPDRCPTFHVYGGDCCHVAEGESLVEEHEWSWHDASAHVWTRKQALNPGEQASHVWLWEELFGCPF